MSYIRLVSRFPFRAENGEGVREFNFSQVCFDLQYFIIIIYKISRKSDKEVIFHRIFPCKSSRKLICPKLELLSSGSGLKKHEVPSLAISTMYM